MLYFIRICIKKSFLFIIVILSFSLVFPVFAAKLDNDGSARNNVDSCYGQSKDIPPSYDNVEYYDAYIPYNITRGEVGGWFTETGYDWGGYFAYNFMATQWAYRLKKTVSTVTVYEFTTQQVKDNWNGWGKICNESNDIDHSKVKYEDDLAVFDDGRGLKYYMSAVQGFQCKNPWSPAVEVGSKSYYNYGASNDPNTMNGSLFDVVLTDGTVIHMIYGDNNADDHTVGPVKEKYAGYGDKASNHQKWVENNNKKTELKLKNYAHLFGACSGHMIEIWGSGVSGFTSKFKLNEDDSGNKIAFYRMYNARITDKVKVSDAAKNNKTFFNVDGIEPGTNQDSGTASPKSDEFKAASLANTPPTVVDKYIPETDLVGIKGTTAMIRDKAEPVELVTRDSFTDSELYAIDQVAESKKVVKANKIVYWVRVVVVFIGLLIALYAVLLLLAYYFDKANNFVDLSLLSILTIGRLSLDNGVVGKSKREVSDKRVFISIIVLFVVAGILISGLQFFIASKIFNFVMERIS